MFKIRLTDDTEAWVRLSCVALVQCDDGFECWFLIGQDPNGSVPLSVEPGEWSRVNKQEVMQ